MEPAYLRIICTIKYLKSEKRQQSMEQMMTWKSYDEILNEYRIENRQLVTVDAIRHRKGFSQASLVWKKLVRGQEVTYLPNNIETEAMFQFSNLKRKLYRLEDNSYTDWFASAKSRLKKKGGPGGRGGGSRVNLRNSKSKLGKGQGYTESWIIKPYYLKHEVYEDYIENIRGVIKLRHLIFWKLMSRRFKVLRKSSSWGTL